MLNNTVTNSYWGIRLGGDANASTAVAGASLNDTLNVVQGNTISNYGGSTLAAHGIWYANLRGTTIRNNTISSSTTATTGLNSTGINASSGGWATISGNTIQNIVAGASFQAISHALSAGDATNPNFVNVDSNIVRACTASSGTFTGISGSGGGAGSIVNIRSNRFENNSWPTTSTAAMTGLSNIISGLGCTLNCTNNIVSGNVLTNPTAAQAFTGITAGAGSSTLSGGTCNNSNNTVRNNTLTAAGTANLMQSSTTLTYNFNNNTITNNRRIVASTAPSVGTTNMVNLIGGSTVNPGSFNNNLLDTFQVVGVPGTLTSFTYGFYVSNTCVAGTTFNNNIIRNITVQGTSTGAQQIYGSNFLLSGPGNIVKGNRIARIGTTTSTNSTGIISTDAQLSGGSMNSYVVGAQLAGSTTAGNTKFFDGNTINTIVAGGSNGIARGIWVSSGTEWYIYNNAISRISAPLANPSTAPTASSSTTVTINGLAVFGIDIANATSGNNYFVYNNTVYLTGAGGGSNFATSGIHANVTPNVTLVNNLVINLTTSGASQAAVAYRRSGALSATYVAGSDNNLYFAGTPSATKLLYGEGVGTPTNGQQTLAALKTYVGATREASSRTENTAFTAAATDSLLHVSTTVATFVESGGKPYPSPALTTDIDGQTRNA
ncbi:MAG: beta strand repeat-containing protein, partial [Bacteroidota bacterium]